MSRLNRNLTPEQRRERIRRNREWRRRSAAAYEQSQREDPDVGKYRTIGPNRERKAREFARAYGSEARVRRLKRMKCAVPFCTRWVCDNAHLEREGISRKGHWSTVVPLCSGGDGHHEMLDRTYSGDVERFDAALGSDLWALAGRLAEEVRP